MKNRNPDQEGWIFKTAALNGKTADKDAIAPTISNLDDLYRQIKIKKTDRLRIVGKIRGGIEGGKAPDQAKRLDRIQSLVRGVLVELPKFQIGK